MSSFPNPVPVDALTEGQSVAGKSDGELLTQFIVSRSEVAFRELVRRHSGVVLAAARRRLNGDHVMVEDAVQQTFILLARQPARAARAISLAAWLHRAATYEASNLLRREIRHRTRAVAAVDGIEAGERDALSPEPPDDWLSALPHLDEALASLNEADRSLLVLHHMEGLTYAEVGERMRCSAGNAQRRGHRALEKLAARLRHRKVNLPMAALASGLSLAVMPNPAHAAVAGRSLAAGGTAGAGAAMLAGLLSPLVLGTAAALVASTAVFWAVGSGNSPSSAPVVSIVKPEMADKAAPPLPPPPIARQKAFEPGKEDDKLTADELEFIKQAKSDPVAAMAWVRQKFPAQNPLFTFMQSAAVALADRDLPAAERLLDVAGINREMVFEGLFASRLKRDFAKAVRWADDWNLTHPTAPQAPFLSYTNYDSGEWRPDIRQALTASRSAPVRNNLIHMESQRLMAEDEAGLEPFAQSLTGEERQRVLEYHLSVLLIRGDERAAEALRTIRPQRLHNTREMALRDPAMILDDYMSQEVKLGEGDFYQTANTLFVEWEREDPEAAKTWTNKYTKEQLFNHTLYRPRELTMKGDRK